MQASSAMRLRGAGGPAKMSVDTPVKVGKVQQPIFIVAPTRRCGTTLLQRALNSTRDVLIYGENFFFTETLPAYVVDRHRNRDRKIANVDYARNRISAGEYDFDASMLFPDYARYATLSLGSLRRVAAFYADDARGLGRPRWGLKEQIRDHRGFAAFMQVFRDARYVFIYRNVLAVAQSEKARFGREYAGPESYGQLAARWCANIRFMKSIERDSVLHLEYDEVAADPNPWVDRIEAHVGVAGIDRTVFERRINVSPLLDRLHAEEGRTFYRRPEGLSSDELAAVRTRAGALASKLGYQL